MKTSLLLPLCVAAFIATPAFAQDKAELRKRAQELEERARQAKEEGRPGQAKEFIEQLRKLRDDAQGDDAEKGRDQKLAHLKQQIDELHKTGRHEEAEQLTKSLQDAVAKGGKEGRKENPDAQRRDHVMAAIKHLHAAGLHEPAERIEQMLREKDAGAGHGDAAELSKHLAKVAGDREDAELLEKLARAQEEAQRRHGEIVMKKEMSYAHEQMQRSLRGIQERTERALKETHAQMEKMARTVDELREQLARQRGEGERRKDEGERRKEKIELPAIPEQKNSN